MIIAHHSENIDWTKGIPADSNLTVTAYSDTMSGPGYRLVPPGRGKEARAYFTAIVDHYDRLPDAMAFIHAHPTSWHTLAGPGNNVGNTWRMAHLTWPVNEYYVPLSVRLIESLIYSRGQCIPPDFDPVGRRSCTTRPTYRHHQPKSRLPTVCDIQVPCSMLLPQCALPMVPGLIMAYGDKPRGGDLNDIDTGVWNRAWDAHFGKYFGGTRPPYVSCGYLSTVGVVFPQGGGFVLL